MSIEERLKVCLDRIEEMKAEGIDLEAALEKLGVTDNE